jgi:hypothetical protein
MTNVVTFPDGPQPASMRLRPARIGRPSFSSARKVTRAVIDDRSIRGRPGVLGHRSLGSREPGARPVR